MKRQVKVFQVSEWVLIAIMLYISRPVESTQIDAPVARTLPSHSTLDPNETMITVDRLKLAYFPVPKCACSSAKHVLYELNHGHSYIPTEGMEYLHSYYPTGQGFVVDDWHKVASMHYTMICIVRDPLSRLKSAYTNRVRFYGEINERQLAEAGIGHLPADPTFDEFARNLFEYQLLPSVRHHTMPMVNFLGTNAECYDIIFDIKKMDQFYEFLDNLSGSKVCRHHRQQGGSNMQVGTLSQIARSQMIDYFHEDYEVFGQYIFAGRP
jgi:hypothetical protein